MGIIAVHMLEYNDDFPLQAVPNKACKYSALSVALTAIGSMSFLAQEVMGALITVNFGFNHLLIALLVCIAIIVPLSIPIVKTAITEHIDIDLLSRSCGFGYLGASFASLIYASYVCAFLVFETLILANMLKNFFNVPEAISYLFISLVVIPIAFKGFKAISKFQKASNYIYIFFEIALLTAVVKFILSDKNIIPGLTEGKDFNWLFLGQSVSILLILIAQTAEQVDYLRFMPEKGSRHRIFYSLSAGAFWFIPISINILCGGALAVFMMEKEASVAAVLDPGYMAYYAYSSLFGHGVFVSLCVLAFVTVCQLKINVTNAYSGSLALSNFGARLTHSYPGRAFWLIFNMVIVLIVLEGNLYTTSINAFNLIAILALSWFTILAVDLSLNRRLKLRPYKIEFKRGNLYDLNPVGTVSLLCAIAVGFVSYSGTCGELCRSYAPLIAMLVAGLLTPFIAFITKGRFYAHGIDVTVNSHGVEVCAVCHEKFDDRNILYCPFIKDYICSHCCSLNALCDNNCNTGSLFYKWFNKKSQRHIFLLIYEYVVLIVIFAFVILIINLGVEKKFALDFKESQNPIITQGFLLFLVVAIFALFFILVLGSRRRAQQELADKNILLNQEIRGHKHTLALLEDEKNKADEANQAKNRYLSGISHELRTPLNVILGYGQLLSRQCNLGREAQGYVDAMVSSGEYLSDLIEGLLDISRIEARKLELRRETVDLRKLIGQLGAYFKRVAAEKGLKFDILSVYEWPPFVITDEKRLRQILTNLISNAIKYTNDGFVKLIILYKFDVYTFRVEDSGIGIKNSDLERIFEPFQRLKDSHSSASGTGLGLTISSLLASIMGGDLEVESTYGKGSTFTLKIYLPAAPNNSVLTKEYDENSIFSDLDRHIKILEIDDNNQHSNLIKKMLSPFGFDVDIASGCKSALDKIKDNHFDIYLIDIAMQDGDGWGLLRILREKGISEPAVIISAEADENNAPADLKHSYSGYLIKPVHLDSLLPMVRSLTGAGHKHDNTLDNALMVKAKVLPDAIKRDFSAYLSIGYIQGIAQIADKLYSQQKIGSAEHKYIQNLVAKTDIKLLNEYLGI